MSTEILDLPDSKMREADVPVGLVALKSLTVVDFAVMSLEDPALKPPRRWKPEYGTYAQALAAAVAVLALALTLYFRYSESAAKSADEHVDKLIEDKLKTATKDINSSIEKQLGPVNDKLSKLILDVGQLQGRFQQLDSGQKKLGNRIAQQESLSKLQDPNRILATIRAEIQSAVAEKRELPSSELADYRNAIHALPPSAANYWVTAAAIINYQSLLNQLSGEAPDPATVSKPCGMLTSGNGMMSFGNTFSGSLQRCIVDLDNQTFRNVTFQDSIVRYHGGPVSLINVSFVNCRFVLAISGASPPARPELLFTILDSSDQKTVTVSK